MLSNSLYSASAFATDSRRGLRRCEEELAEIGLDEHAVLDGHAVPRVDETARLEVSAQERCEVFFRDLDLCFHGYLLS